MYLLLVLSIQKRVFLLLERGKVMSFILPFQLHLAMASTFEVTNARLIPTLSGLEVEAY